MFPPLVSPELLSQHLSSQDVVVLDTTWARDPLAKDGPKARFAEEHIPGARFFPLHEATNTESGLFDTVCGAEQFQALVRRLGITNQHVVCAAQGPFTSAARAFWLFRLFGHERISVLDGGLATWKEAGLPLESGETETPVPGEFVAQENRALFRDLEQLVAELDEGSCQLVDARPSAIFEGVRDFFAGTESPAVGRPGRIPGAVNLPGSVLVEGGRLRSKEALLEVLQERGLDPEKPTVSTCSLGVGASGLAFVFYLLGNTKVAVFDGSWEEWAASGFPRATG
jgi:thiosulfate/3-mercaptopyruvate sulfurtransferase